MQGYLAALAARRGDRGEALRIAAWLESLDSTYQYGYNTMWRVRIAALLGEQAGALRLLVAAFTEGLKHSGTFVPDTPARTFGPWLHRDVDLESLRTHPQFLQLMHPNE